jgi:two-component system sensor kinase FixL
VEVGDGGGVPALYIDAIQVELVLRNLIANAVDSLRASHAPNPRIQVMLVEMGGRMARLTVGDNGPGIPPAMRARLFEPFASGKPVGMVMGLAVSRAIAEAHGGTLEAAPGPQARFDLVLPCMPTD